MVNNNVYMFFRCENYNLDCQKQFSIILSLSVGLRTTRGKPIKRFHFVFEHQPASANLISIEIILRVIECLHCELKYQKLFCDPHLLEYRCCR